MSGRIRIAIVGLGEIARREHLPAIAAGSAFALAATVDPHQDGVAGVPNARSLGELQDRHAPIDAVAICTPPQARYALAAEALERGLHVLLEKPPGATVSEVVALDRMARRSGLTLFASWHSRFAAAVEPARDWLANRLIQAVRIVWREDVHVWHPRQEWIWRPGGLGVFDPGINALSIATRILPRDLIFRSGTLELPSNVDAPIAATLHFVDTAATPVAAEFDWRQIGPQTWDIVIETDAGTCTLSEGGAVFTHAAGIERGESREYDRLYQRFAKLVAACESEVDLRPLQLVADAFLRAERVAVGAVQPWQPHRSALGVEAG